MKPLDRWTAETVAPRPAGAQSGGSELAGKRAKFSCFSRCQLCSPAPPSRRGRRAAGLAPSPALSLLGGRTPAPIPRGASLGCWPLFGVSGIFARTSPLGGCSRGALPQRGERVPPRKKRRQARGCADGHVPPPLWAPCYSHSMSHSPAVSLPSTGHAGSCNTRPGAEGAPSRARAAPLAGTCGTERDSTAPPHPAGGPLAGTRR